MKTNYIEQAIRKAIEGGWILRGGLPTVKAEKLSIAHPNVRVYYDDGSMPMAYVDVEFAEIALDPSFWQSLGKQQGWIDKKPVYSGLRLIDAEWKYRLHQFIDHLIAGKDPESFFKEILTQ